MTESLSFGVTDSAAFVDVGGRFVFGDGDEFICRIFIFENCLV